MTDDCKGDFFGEFNLFMVEGIPRISASLGLSSRTWQPVVKEEKNALASKFLCALIGLQYTRDKKDREPSTCTGILLRGESARALRFRLEDLRP